MKRVFVSGDWDGNFWLLLLDQIMDFMKRRIRLFKYTHARISILGTKWLHKFNLHVRKLIWIFPGTSYSFRLIWEPKDWAATYNDRWISFISHGTGTSHGVFAAIGDSYSVNTKFWGTPTPPPMHMNWTEAHLCSTEHIDNKLQLRKLGENNFFKTHF